LGHELGNPLQGEELNAGCDTCPIEDVMDELPPPVNGTKLPNNFCLFAVPDMDYDSNNPALHFVL